MSHDRKTLTTDACAALTDNQNSPLIEVGVMALNRNQDNYFVQVEQASFSPANVVPGIGFSPDKVLQFRIFSYADAARYQLGANHDQLPMKQLRCPVHNYARDGQMRFGDNGGGSVNYEPNSFGDPVEDPSVKEPPLKISGDTDRYDHRVGNDDYSQPGDLFRLMSADQQQQQLFNNIAAAIQDMPEVIRAASARSLRQGRSGVRCRRGEGLGYCGLSDRCKRCRKILLRGLRSRFSEHAMRHLQPGPRPR